MHAPQVIPPDLARKVRTIFSSWSLIRRGKKLQCGSTRCKKENETVPRHTDQCARIELRREAKKARAPSVRRVPVAKNFSIFFPPVGYFVDSRLKRTLSTWELQQDWSTCPRVAVRGNLIAFFGYFLTHSSWLRLEDKNCCIFSIIGWSSDIKAIEFRKPK